MENSKLKDKNNSFNEIINNCGLKKTYVYLGFLLINIICIPLIYYSIQTVQKIYLIIPFVLLGICANAFYIEWLKRLKKERDENEILNFIEIFRYINVYLRNGMTVYQSLNYVINYSSPLMENKLRKLVTDIDNDKTVKPYINFAESFDLPLIREVMINLYLINEEGDNKDYIEQYNNLFNALLQANEDEAHKLTINSLETLCFTPLIGSSMSMILVTIGIIHMMEGVGNGW